jgi:hypothetical protein
MEFSASAASSSSPRRCLDNRGPRGVYSLEFYEAVRRGALQSAERVLPLVFDPVDPATAIDILEIMTVPSAGISGPALSAFVAYLL